jgi:hypothetical protein
MKRRPAAILMLSVLLVVLGSGPDLSHGARPAELAEKTDADIRLAASAPWFKIEVDTPGDTGQYTSHDATKGHLKHL